MIEIGLPTATRGCVREKRRTRAVVDNPQPAEIALKKPFRTVLTNGATSLFLFTTRGDRLVFGFFPFQRGVFGCGASDLNNMTSRPSLLMLHFSPFKICCNPAVPDLVSDFVIVLLVISSCHGISLRRLLRSKKERFVSLAYYSANLAISSTVQT